MPSTRLFVAVAILVVVLLTAGWWAADIQTAQMQRWLATGHLPPIGNPWKGTSTPDFNYYMTINAICVSLSSCVSLGTKRSSVSVCSSTGCRPSRKQSMLSSRISGRL